MRATAAVLAAMIRFAYAQDRDDIPKCARDCLALSPSDLCHVMKNPDCACRLGTRDTMRTQWAVCTQNFCSYEETTFEDVWRPFAAYCVANGWLNASQTDLISIVTLTKTPIIIVTRTISATSGGDETHTTVELETSTSETEAGSTTAQAATPMVQSTAPIAEITPTAEPTSAIDGDNSASSSDQLSTGVKAGIGAGAALVAILAVILLFWWRKRKKASLSDGDEDNIISELGGGDKSNRYELDSYTTPLEADKKNPETFSNQQNQIMAELDGTPCASPEPKIHETHKVAPSIEQGAVSLEVVSTISLPKSPPSSATSRMSPPMIEDRINSSPEPLIVDMAELEHLLHEERLLRDRRQTLEQLQRIQADEFALGERIRTLRQNRS
ncbi:transmembrane alpha-helix domain-containing protein [Colletotrichum orchidophilum]|uniref:Transmembrane alpha-helix domain-containing protein n=1 Tax=Colletotrichum orchidophilum TaxID=1209926 RepID=A0A1G4B179_9PEZI|nr:transmembrane alpha-helix domain-containing protein [Colletotrichum orchidophilum]OHE95189.1 transmembrane alpha-helix domain-containing protein [Colletotrichum orchidophilum]